MKNPAEPHSSNHQFLLNLAQMLGLVSEWLWQEKKNGLKYFIPFNLLGPSGKMANWH